MSNPDQLNDTADRNTLYVKSLAGELKRDEIVSHFSAFGDIRNVRIRNKPRKSYGFVKFVRTESATRALEIDFDAIAGRRVKITLAHDRHQDRPSHLVLNDDCIHGILSMECLSEMDLCSVAETSRRLKDIALRVFRRKYAKCDLSSLANREVKPTQRILRNFGAVMSELEIGGWHFKDNWTSVLDSVAKYCSNTLESLYLRECVIPDTFTAKLGPLFNRLQKLKIDSCRFEGSSKELFADCGSLVVLKLWDGFEDSALIVENTFPKLQKFEFEADDGMNFDSFILRHKNLTSIAIWNSIEMSSIPTIGDNCKRLEELEFDIREDKAVDLSNLGHLRKLKINFCGRNDIKAVRGWKNLQFLENLTLEWASFDAEFFETLSQLKRLQVLRLKYCHGLENLHRIGDLKQIKELEIQYNGTVDLNFVLLIKRLSNLKFLSVVAYDFKMDLETYLRIVDVVRARRDKSKLTFKIHTVESKLYDADMLHNFSFNAHLVEMIVDN